MSSALIAVAGVLAVSSPPAVEPAWVWTSDNVMIGHLYSASRPLKDAIEHAWADPVGFCAGVRYVAGFQGDVTAYSVFVTFGPKLGLECPAHGLPRWSASTTFG